MLDFRLLVCHLNFNDTVDIVFRKYNQLNRPSKLSPFRWIMSPVDFKQILILSFNKFTLFYFHIP